MVLKFGIEFGIEFDWEEWDKMLEKKRAKIPSQTIEGEKHRNTFKAFMS